MRDTQESTVRLDREVAVTSGLYCGLMVLSLLTQYVIEGQYGVAPFFFLLLASLHLTLVRKSISDPTVVILLFGFIYASFPLMFGTPYSLGSLGFSFDGAAMIYGVGSASMLLGSSLSAAYIQTGKHPRHVPRTNPVSRYAGVLAASSSLILSFVHMARSGSVLLGDISYGESFQAQLQQGEGFFLLAVPLAAAGVVMLLTSRATLKPHHHLLGLGAYLALFVSLGQRKYLIIPAVFYVATYYKVSSIKRLALMIIGCAMGLIVFMYLGFLRTNNYALSQASDPGVLTQFVGGGEESLGGESIPVFATATAAHEGFVGALAYGGDYTKSWMMCLPNFIFGSPFSPLNMRFATIFAPQRAAKGQGWGFSFFGEAYLVGGYPGVVVATLVMVIAFRVLYVSGGRDRRWGLKGAVSLSSLPFAFWFQRNAFSFFFKEFMVLQIGCIVLCYAVAKFLAFRHAPKLPQKVAPRSGVHFGHARSI